MLTLTLAREGLVTENLVFAKQYCRLLGHEQSSAQRRKNKPNCCQLVNDSMHS